MSLLWVDSFDNVGTGFAYRAKYDSFTGTMSFVTGRTGNGMNPNQGNISVIKALPNSSILFAGFAFKITTNALTSARGTILTFLDTGTNQISLAINSAGNLLVYSQTTLLGTGTSVLAINTFYYIEIKVVFHGTSGTINVRINEASELSLSSQNTAPSGNNQSNAIRIGLINADGASNSISVIYDDLYVLNDSGSTNNNFLGDVKVECLFPNGNGNASNWVNNSGNSTNNYTRVDDNPPNDDTDYVQDATNGDRDLYTFTDLSSSAANVFGIQVVNYSKKTDAGTKKIANTVRTNGTNYDSSGVNVSDSYSYISNILELNPDSGTAWTVTQINALEAGVKVDS